MRTTAAFFIRLATLSILAGAAHAELIESFLNSPLAERFGAPPSIAAPRLSPNGGELIFLQQDEQGVSSVYRFDFAAEELLPVIRGTADSVDVTWCEWASASRLICRLRDLENVFGRSLSYSLAIDGTDFHRISIACPSFLPDADETDSVISICGQPARVDLYSRVLEGVPELRRADGPDFNFMQPVVDGRGYVRAGRIRASRDRWYGREDGGAEWTRFMTIRYVSFQDPLIPVGFGTDQSELLHIAWSGSRLSLYAKQLGGDFSDREVLSHPLYDLEHVTRIGADHRVVAGIYLDEIPRQYIFDERVAAAHGIAADALPASAIEVLNESWDQSAYVVRAREPERAGVLYRIDMAHESVGLIGAEYSHLDGVALAPTRTVEFAGDDGGLVTGHLTVPVHVGLPVPAIIMPRAAPFSWDVQDPHFLVQYLVASGYAVLRVEQRGSAEYGGSWLVEKVLVGVDQAVSDVIAASEYLVSEGIAVPGQLCGAGRDVGAYTLFMTDIVSPQTFECILSIRGDSDSWSLPRSPRIYADLDELSPIKRADEISAELLLVEDYYRQQTHDFVNRLEPRTAEVTLVEYQHSKRDLDRATNRIDMLTRVGDFLGRHLEGARAIALDAVAD